MNVIQFRQTPELVAEMRKILENPVLVTWLGAMEETNPARKPAPIGIQPHEAHIMLGEQTGWMSYRDDFREGGQHIEILKSDRDPEDQTYADHPPDEPEIP